MSLVDHLSELRNRLLIAAAAVVLTTTIGFFWYTNSFFGFHSLGEWLRGPYCSLPASARATIAPDGECRLLATAPFDQFMLRLKVALTAASSWPARSAVPDLGLHHAGAVQEGTSLAMAFVTVGAALFVTGSVPRLRRAVEGAALPADRRQRCAGHRAVGEQYFGFLINLLLVFGISFEFPLLIVMLNMVGVLTYDRLKSWRRGLIFGCSSSPRSQRRVRPVLDARPGGGAVALLEVSIRSPVCTTGARRAERSWSTFPTTRRR
jgi:sec-independent protein translocase protein TatC